MAGPTVPAVGPDGTPLTVPADRVPELEASGGHVQTPQQASEEDAADAAARAPFTAGDYAESSLAGVHALQRGTLEAVGAPLDKGITGIAGLFGEGARKSTASYLQGLDKRHPYLTAGTGLLGNVGGAVGAAAALGLPGGIGVAPVAGARGVAARVAVGGLENVVQATTKDINEDALGDRATNAESLVANMPKHFVVGGLLAGTFEGGAHVLGKGFSAVTRKAVPFLEEGTSRAVGREIGLTGDEALEAGTTVRELTGGSVPTTRQGLADVLLGEQGAQRARSAADASSAADALAGAQTTEAALLSAQQEAARKELAAAGGRGVRAAEGEAGAGEWDAAARRDAGVEEARASGAAQVEGARAAHAAAGEEALGAADRVVEAGAARESGIAAIIADTKRQVAEVTDHFGAVDRTLQAEHKTALDQLEAIAAEHEAAAQDLTKAIRRLEEAQAGTSRGSAKQQLIAYRKGLGPKPSPSGSKMQYARRPRSMLELGDELPTPELDPAKVVALAQKGDAAAAQLSPGEVDAVHSFTERGGDKIGTPEWESAIQKLTVENPTDAGPLYRGTRMSAERVASVLKAGKLSIKEPTSLSFNQGIADAFAESRVARGEKVMLVVEGLKDGQNFLSRQLGIGRSGLEREINVARPTDFDVVGTFVDAEGVRHIRLQDTRLMQAHLGAIAEQRAAASGSAAAAKETARLTALKRSLVAAREHAETHASAVEKAIRQNAAEARKAVRGVTMAGEQARAQAAASMTAPVENASVRSRHAMRAVEEAQRNVSRVEAETAAYVEKARAEGGEALAKAEKRGAARIASAKADAAAAMAKFEKGAEGARAELSGTHERQVAKLPGPSEETSVDALVKRMGQGHASAPLVTGHAAMGAGLSLMHGNPVSAVAALGASFAAGRARNHGNLIAARTLRGLSVTLSSVDQAIREGATAALTGAATKTARAATNVDIEQGRPSFDELASNLVDLHANPMELERRVRGSVGHIAEDAPGTYQEILATAQRAQQFLLGILPPPQVDPYSLTPHQGPGDVSEAAQWDFMHAADTIGDPLSVFAGIKDGTISQIQVDSIQAVYPSLFDKMRNEVRLQSAFLPGPLDYEREIHVGTLLGQVTNEVLDPDFQGLMSDSYKNKAAQSQSPNAAPSGGSMSKSTKNMMSGSESIEGAAQ